VCVDAVLPGALDGRGQRRQVLHPVRRRGGGREDGARGLLTQPRQQGSGAVDGLPGETQGGGVREGLGQRAHAVRVERLGQLGLRLVAPTLPGAVRVQLRLRA